MPIAIPEVLGVHHEELHDELARATREPHALGEAAKRVQKLVWAHVEREESFVLPLLGLLEEAARGERPTELAEALELAGRAQREMKDLLVEHSIIAGALKEFVDAAKAARRVEYAELAVKLLHHSQLEERVLYPAVVLLGEYLRARFGEAGVSALRAAA